MAKETMDNHNHDYVFSSYCGAWVCTFTETIQGGYIIECADHKELARCFCGWNLEPGERLEDDVDY